jgi:phosphoribosylcarboxyaminoimidazole (NCAIR) mutase
MPYGVPVGTMAINGSKNAALLAIRILGMTDPVIASKMIDFMKQQTEDVLNHKEVLGL